MEKIFTPYGWDFGQAPVALVKFSSRGLRGSDLDALIKRAGDEFAFRVRDLIWPSNLEPVHMIAMGSTERFGPNRNGDGFKEAELARTHERFVKDARFHRHHKNQPSDPHYGRPKYSALHLGRVELLVGLNKDAQAAEEHGGEVADEELAMLARGEDLPVSMSTKIAFDVCDNCGNKARTRNDYCTATNCVSPKGIRRGGCKQAMMRVYDDGHVQHVDNPNPYFFDISRVGRQADRIAFGCLADYLHNKSAHLYSDQLPATDGFTDTGHLCGAAAAELFKSGGLFDPGPAPSARAERLANLAGYVSRMVSLWQKQASQPNPPQLRLAWNPGQLAWNRPRGDYHRRLKSAGILLPLPVWCQLEQLNYPPELQKAAETLLPAAYDALRDPRQMTRWLPAAEPPSPHAMHTSDWLAPYKAAYAVDPRDVRRRLEQAIVRGASVPSATIKQSMDLREADRTTGQLALKYAAYQLDVLDWLSQANRTDELRSACYLLAASAA